MLAYQPATFSWPQAIWGAAQECAYAVHLYVCATLVIAGR
jgi:hypothetical protein